MLLADLLRAARIAAVSAHPIEIGGISYDSRTTALGDLFVAIPGFHTDGARYVDAAFRRGAVAAVVDREAINGPPASTARDLAQVVAVEDTRAALAALAAAWFGFPAKRLTTIGVTGTDGKTSSSYLIAELLNAAALPTGLFTTVAYLVGGRWEDNESRQTTPEAPDVQHLLRRMADAGDRYAVLESTSHGLELHKLDHCEYDVAVFTNLSPDHLDFHGTLERYRAAKARLFEMLDTSVDKGCPKLAVLNGDDPAAAFMAGRTRATKLTYAIDAAADVRPHALHLDADGADIAVTTPAGDVEFRLPLPGRFSVYNALAALAVAVSLGVSAQTVAAALSAAQSVPGRMQRIDAGQPFAVVVDYAHTGAAFRKVLETLRPLTRGRLIVVFGCAGERGVERRTGMGEAATRGADYTVITTEDPRSEPPEAIIAQIAEAMRAGGSEEGRDFECVTDRRSAIARAFELAQSGDLVLLTGKGHEHSIEMADGRVAWDEAAIARTLLDERYAKAGRHGDA